MCHIVVWKISPTFAEWITTINNNPLWTNSILSPTSTIIELGCGVSGIVAIALAPLVNYYIATDQEYVRKIFWSNVRENVRHHRNQNQRKNNNGGRGNRYSRGHTNNNNNNDNDEDINISFIPLDWETDIPVSLKDTIPTNNNNNRHGLGGDTNTEKDPGFDILISCDCIYNESLTKPLLNTCVEICQLRPKLNHTNINTNTTDDTRRPTICLIAQRLRSPDVFETWLHEALFIFGFRVWRIRDDLLPDSLKTEINSNGCDYSSGSVVHVLVLGV